MKRRLLPLTLLLLSFNFGYSQIYVDSSATGANNGTSWPNAFTDLKTALNAATTGSEIWVAKGTYKPAGMNGDPASTFLINTNLQLLGGYNSSTGVRDPEMYETILSGDLNGDDVEDDFIMHKADNVMTVVTVNSNITNETWIDGFIVQNGYADGTVFSNGEQNGGAIFTQGSPIVRNCIFKQNYAFAGGGAIMHPPAAGQATIIDNCVFEKNTATFGGAIAFPWSNFNIK